MRRHREPCKRPRCQRCHEEKVPIYQPGGLFRYPIWRCERCDAPPVVFPFMDRSKLFRFKKTSGKEDSPGWDNTVRAIEDYQAEDMP